MEENRGDHDQETVRTVMGSRGEKNKEKFVSLKFVYNKNFCSYLKVEIVSLRSPLD